MKDSRGKKIHINKIIQYQREVRVFIHICKADIFIPSKSIFSLFTPIIQTFVSFPQHPFTFTVFLYPILHFNAHISIILILGFWEFFISGKKCVFFFLFFPLGFWWSRSVFEVFLELGFGYYYVGFLIIMFL